MEDQDYEYDFDQNTAPNRYQDGHYPSHDLDPPENFDMMYDVDDADG